MEQRLKIAAILSMLALSVYFGIENLLLKKELANLIEKNEAITAELGEAKEIFSNNSSSIPNDTSYVTWEKSLRKAQQFYNESDGQFPKNWGIFLAEKAQQYSIDPYILFELIRVETGGTFEPNTVGPQTKFGRAYGLAQFMENTGPWIAEMADLNYKKELLYNPYYSIELAAAYLDFLYNRYGDWDYALTAYHRGMKGLEQYIDKRGHAKSWYAEEIQEKAQELEVVVANN